LAQAGLTELFGESSARFWTVIGGIAAVAGLVWTIYAAHYSGGSPATPKTSVTSAPHGKSRRLDDVWVAQLASVPIAAGSSQLHAVLARAQSEVPGARYLNSSDYGSLNSGYWMVYFAGNFQNGNQALAFCADHGRYTRNQCVGRFLSHNPADRKLICFPPAGSQSTGCYRSSHEPAAWERADVINPIDLQASQAGPSRWRRSATPIQGVTLSDGECPGRTLTEPPFWSSRR
jgi:hypothetical protein